MYLVCTKEEHGDRGGCSAVGFEPNTGNLPAKHFYKGMLQGHMMWKVALGPPLERSDMGPGV